MKTVGFIGIGKMGLPMVRHLLRKGYAVVAYDIAPANLQGAVSEGAQPAASEAEAVAQAEVTVLSLPNVPVLEAVVGKLERLDLTGKTIIDTTTSTMKASADLAARVAARGGTMLDAPITGGTAGAERAALSFFVGGDAAAYEAHRDVLAAMGTSFVRIGESGHGQVGKMVCQMIGSVGMCITAEAMGMAAQLGVDIRKVNEAFGEHRPGLLDRMVQLLDETDLGDEGYMAQRSKDIDYCVEEAARHKCYIPVTHAMNQVYTLARLQGLGDAYPTALFKVWETILGRPLAEIGHGR